MYHPEGTPWGYEEVREDEWNFIEQAMLMVEGNGNGTQDLPETAVNSAESREAVAQSFASQRAREWQARLIQSGCDPLQAQRKGGEKVVADAAAARARLSAVNRLECAAATP
eukprot:CAMPEP_0177788624 /NCGR_PEP_ID=MMETSP0491_2-20121128/22242_1 /TAXON_ID=63592 /ORGANISM="Tetraselmis chuii, Strain PLY429" /LENGTH=111 /DNA_ID=CAMNT_0019310287 /DNA_START=308 /DNA_END=641 /DNA_ORIENTATION=+